jgi:hypothetical protein
MTTFRIYSLLAIGLGLSACDAPSRKAAVTEAQPLEKAATELPQTVSFNEHIQPVLSEYCYHCHGPD